MGSLLELGSEYSRMLQKKIGPGPASKTLRDLIVPSAKEHTNAPSLDRMGQDDRENDVVPAASNFHVSPETSFVSDTSDTMSLNDPQYVPNPCSNFTKASSSAIVSLPASSPSSRMKVPCIFCADPVSQENLNSDGDHPHNQEFRKMLKALYRNFQINDVPPNSTEMMFPFCKSCKKDVAEIFREQRTIDEAKKRIGNHLANIEKNVAEMELLKPKTIVKTEKCEFTNLIDKILEGIRCKLLMQKVLRKSGKPLGQTHDFGAALAIPNLTLRDNTVRIRGQFEEAKKNFRINPSQLLENGPGSSSGPGGSRVHQETRMTVDVSPTDVCPDLNLGTEQKSKVQSESMDASDIVIGEYNETSCTMVISDVRSESGNGSEPATPAAEVQENEDDEVVFVKKEVGTPSLRAQTFSRTKRSIFRGVSIYRIREPTGNSLQCGVCHLLVPITDACYPGSSPYDKMTTHIMTEHHCRVQPKKPPRLRPQSVFAGKRTWSSSASASSSTANALNGNGESLTPRRRSQRSVEFACQNCNEKFPSKLLRREHNQLVHSSSTRKAYENPTNLYQQLCQIMDCEICGKPIRGTYINMMAHKFSHKNDEERKIAIANNEPGCRSSMLSRNGIGLNKKKNASGRTRNPSKESPRRRKYRKRSKFWLATGAQNMNRSSANNNCEWECHMCQRLFSKQNHYTNHMKMHARKRDHEKAAWETPGPSTGSSSNEVTIAARVPPIAIYARNMNGDQIVIGERFNPDSMMGDDNVEVYNDRAC